jgi:hypothetical protein
VSGPFVELTFTRTGRAERPPGSKVLVNMDHVVYVHREPDQDFTRVVLVTPEPDFNIQETPGDIWKLMQSGRGARETDQERAERKQLGAHLREQHPIGVPDPPLGHQ